MAGRSTTASGVAKGGGAAVYESDKAVHEYLQFHFATPETLVPWECRPAAALDFPKRCADAATRHVTGAKSKALDIGCAVGGATFEFAANFDEVVGIDFSHAFIAAANVMKDKGEAPYTTVEEGETTSEKVARVRDGIDRSRVTFAQGDACNLDAGLEGFDAVLAANLLCRLPDPQAFLARLGNGLVKPGGVVAIISPYSWLEEYTPKEKWLNAGGEDSFVALRRIMEAKFDLVEQSEAPFLIREHRRKFQWGCSDCTVWRRKA